MVMQNIFFKISSTTISIINQYEYLLMQKIV